MNTIWLCKTEKKEVSSKRFPDFRCYINLFFGHTYVIVLLYYFSIFVWGGMAFRR